MKTLAIGLVAASLLFGDAAEAASCKTPELSDYQPYNELVCNGIAQMEAKNYSRAIEDFEKASAINLPEEPNFKLLPRLAVAYFKMGDKSKAQVLLEKAELALRVYTRIARCMESDNDMKLATYSGGSLTPIVSRHSEEVAKLMCGAAYDSIYEPSLEEVRHDGELVDLFLSAKRTISNKDK